MKAVHIALAIIINEHRTEVLIAWRLPYKHQGGMWEFPGGKVRAGESVYEALTREVKEELDLAVFSADQLITVTHKYTDKTVLLDVWQVTCFHGVPHGQEGQEIRWRRIDCLNKEDFPAANHSIITAIRERFGITKYSKKRPYK